MSESAVGFRVKSGWAVAVLLTAGTESPVLLDVRRVELSDPGIPDSMQPFHAALELPKDKGPKEAARLVKVVERFAARSLKALLEEYGSKGHRLRGAGLVVGSQIDPSTIKNDHIRAHAEEGRLFRSVIVDALKGFGLESEVFSEKDLYGGASTVLRRPASQLRKDLKEMGREVSGRWRSEEKCAALAAWIAVR